MNTLDMIKKISKTPDQYYTGQYGKVCYKDGILSWADNNEPVVINDLFLGVKWQKVLEPMDFMTVVKKMNNNKTLKIDHALIRNSPANMVFYDYFDTFLNLLEKLAYRFNSKEVAQIIVEGEWFIKEE